MRTSSFVRLALPRLRPICRRNDGQASSTAPPACLRPIKPQQARMGLYSAAATLSTYSYKHLLLLSVAIVLLTLGAVLVGLDILSSQLLANNPQNRIKLLASIGIDEYSADRRTDARLLIAGFFHPYW